MENKHTELTVLEEIQYPVTMDEIKKDMETYMGVKDIDPESDNAGVEYQHANKGRMVFVKHRTGIEKDRKRLKAPALEYGKTVDRIAKELTALAEPTEKRLSEICKSVDDYEQKKQDDLIRIEMERTNLIDKTIEAMRMLPLAYIGESSLMISDALECLEVPTVEMYEEKLDYAKEVYATARLQLTNALETKKLAEEQSIAQAKKDEEHRLQKIENDKALEVEREALRVERAELDAEKAKIAKATADASETERLKLLEVQEQEALQLEAEKRKEVERQNAVAKEKLALKINEYRAETIEDLTIGGACTLAVDDAMCLLDMILDGHVRHLSFGA